MLRKDLDEVWQGLLPASNCTNHHQINTSSAIGTTTSSSASSSPIILNQRPKLTTRHLTHSISFSGHKYTGYEITTPTIGNCNTSNNSNSQTEYKLVTRDQKIYQRLSNSPSPTCQTSVNMNVSYPEQDSLSPHSTVTTETGDQLLYRMKQAGATTINALKHQTSWTSSSARNEVANTINSSTREKFSIKQMAIFPTKSKRRVVDKNGVINVNKERVEKRHQRYLQDTFTTMVDIQWRWNLLVFASGFLISWFVFAIIWWVICLAHGDFDHIGDEKWTPCVAAVESFTTAFLFSIETQHTIGYGGRATTEECPEAIFVMCLQSITGVVIQCFVVGFVFAKLSRPQKRSQTILFSTNGVICTRDGKLCLMFRIGDVRNRSHIIDASVTAIVISRKSTIEGETIPFYQTEIPVKFDGSQNSLFLIWPATVVHVIDESSPFYNLSCDTIMREKFEVVLMLEGTVESTGQSFQARSSYLPSEILWGRRFEQMVLYKKDTGEYRVDYSRFNSTYEVEIPPCSAKELNSISSKLPDSHGQRNNIHFKLPQGPTVDFISPQLLHNYPSPPFVNSDRDSCITNNNFEV